MYLMIAAASIVLLTAAGLVFHRHRRYRGCFRIPARRDDVYRFRTPPRTFRLSAGRILQWPDAPFRPGSSAFLALDLQATVPGRVLDPYIEFQAGPVSGRQYFERGAAGRRYLNLSRALQASFPASGSQPLPSPAAVGLRGRHIRWSQQAELLVFDPPPRTGDVLILSPHPDDSELAAFGLYSSRNSWVVTITAGERSPTDLSAIVDDAEKSRWLARLRVWDSLTVPRLGGVSPQRCLNLVFPDTRLKSMRERPHESFQLSGDDGSLRASLRSANPLEEFRQASALVTWTDLVSELRQVLEIARPTTLVCPHPLMDPHHDHVFSSVALADALHAGAHRPEVILLYVIHANEAPLFPFGDTNSIVSLPPYNDAEWTAESLYSHPLSEDTRRAKYFAVEAAHDLRAYGDSRPPGLARLARTLRREILDFLTGMSSRPTDFLRRAPRPNEVFFVVSTDAFLELARRAGQSEMRHGGPRNRARSPRTAVDGNCPK